MVGIYVSLCAKSLDVKLLCCLPGVVVWLIFVRCAAAHLHSPLVPTFYSTIGKTSAARWCFDAAPLYNALVRLLFGHQNVT